MGADVAFYDSDRDADLIAGNGQDERHFDEEQEHERTEQMPSYKTAFGSYLKTEDLQGKAIRVAIEHIAIEEMKGDAGMEKKLCAHFAGKDKALILNRTNCEALEAITGSDDYEEWAGHTVILFPTTTKFAGKTVPCLRIRANVVATKAAPPPPPVLEPAIELDEDSIPF